MSTKVKDYSDFGNPEYKFGGYQNPDEASMSDYVNKRPSNNFNGEYGVFAPSGNDSTDVLMWKIKHSPIGRIHQLIDNVNSRDLPIVATAIVEKAEENGVEVPAELSDPDLLYDQLMYGGTSILKLLHDTLDEAAEVPERSNYVEIIKSPEQAYGRYYPSPEEPESFDEDSLYDQVMYGGFNGRPSITREISDMIDEEKNTKIGGDESTYGEYTVKRGDSLWKIAKMYGMTVNELREANGIEGNMIKPGQKLKVDWVVTPSSGMSDFDKAYAKAYNDGMDIMYWNGKPIKVGGDRPDSKKRSENKQRYSQTPSLEEALDGRVGSIDVESTSFEDRISEIENRMRGLMEATQYIPSEPKPKPKHRPRNK